MYKPGWTIIWAPQCLSCRAFAEHSLDQAVWPQQNPTTISVHHTLLALKPGVPGVTNRSGEWQTSRVSRMQPAAMEIQASFLHICAAQANVTSSYCEKSWLRVSWRVGFVPHSFSLLPNPVMSGRTCQDVSWKEMSTAWLSIDVQVYCRQNKVYCLTDEPATKDMSF